jgi:hypothetical protein
MIKQTKINNPVLIGTATGKNQPLLENCIDIKNKNKVMETKSISK